MRILVCGGRDYSDRAKVFRVLDEIAPSHVVQGGAQGADALAREWAQARCIPFTTYPANWRLYGKRAGRVRNHAMLKERPDAVVAFPGGAGTAHMVTLAVEHGIIVHEWRSPANDNAPR